MIGGLDVSVVPDADERFAGVAPGSVLLVTKPGAVVASGMLVRESEWPRVREALVRDAARAAVRSLLP